MDRLRLLVPVLLLCSCTTTETVYVDKDNGSTDTGGKDSTLPGDVRFEEIPVEEDVPPDYVPPDAAPSDVPLVEGEFGWPCTQATDCNSGYCILTGEKKICTSMCETECPDGFVCAPVTNTPPDVTYICLPRYDKLCQPCAEHKDCQPIWGAGTDLCLDYGQDGKFCGAECTDAACPEGYDCVVEKASDGSSVQQCRKAKGQGACECSALSKYLQLTTPCSASNEFGTCSGQRRCEAAGLSACDAGEPAEEVCNDVDDDCNGTVDDAASVSCLVTGEFGSCPGTTACSLGKEICQGTAPAKDVCDGKDNDCNGFTDEGFPDADGDGQADCIDDDDDDDGILDGNDNCPLKANADQANQDLDAFGDACDPDMDNDGASNASDCKPLDPKVYPFAVETCDGLDNDCDGPVDEGSCDDSNLCTDDVCDPALGCQHVFNSDPCNDSNPCTLEDHCSFGQCSGSFMSCEDNNPCTANSCDPKMGCTFTYLGGACDDGNPCTKNDVCAQGVCAGVVSGCDCTSDSDCAAAEDGNLCNGTLKCDKSTAPFKCVVDPASVPSCTLPPGSDPVCAKPACNSETGKCEVAPQNNGQVCNDGNLCTVNEICAGGLCVGQPKDCKDANLCTDDTCDPVTGCAHTYNTNPCDDGNPCTLGDACQGGQCVAGGAVPCDDGNPCTTDSCFPGQGCQHTNNTLPCNDKNACTQTDLCISGVCTGSNPLQCDDGNACTNDFCDPASGCKYTYNEAPCNDGNKCTTGDVCQGGTCVGSGLLACNDFNPCTTDTCDPVNGCSYSLNTLPCDDGNACTNTDTCAAGVCSGKAVSCADGNPCTSDACDPVKGCTFAPVAGPCDDGNPCTVGDSCQLGKCLSGNAISCDDGNPCTKDTCGQGGQCSYAALDGVACDDGNECTVNDFCVAGKCYGSGNPSCCLKDADCDDGNQCTKDTCVLETGQCLSQAAPMNGLACNKDDNGCTGGDSCSNGVCNVGAPVDCSGTADACNAAVCQSTGIQTYKCVKSPKTKGTPCEDGKFCTTGDTCDGLGACSSGPAVDCTKLSGGCISGVCNESLDKCEGTPVTDGKPCNADDNGCTAGDKCVAGNCVKGAPADCSWLSAACIIGVCNPTGPSNPDGFTCEPQFKPKGTSCNDGLYCTVSDQCDDTGWCGGGTPNPCDAVKDSCNDAQCKEDVDKCLPVPKPNGTACNDNDACTMGDACQNCVCTGTSNVCGEYKVSTFHTNFAGVAPALADHKDGRYLLFWDDSNQDQYFARSYTNSWSKEWTEFDAYTGGDENLSVDADGFPDGKVVAAFTHRKKTYNISSTYCDYQSSSSNSCANGYCCTSCSGNCSSYCYSRPFTKYSGSKSIEERIFLKWYNLDNSVSKTVSVFERNASTSHSYDCTNPPQYVYASPFGNVRLAATPAGNTLLLWQDGADVKGRIYNSAGTQTKDFGTLGTSWAGFDVASRADDTFVITWSASGNVYAQIYTASGTPDGSQIVVSDSAGTQANPAIDANNQGRFIIAWESNGDGDNDIYFKIFKIDGSPLGPPEAKVNTTDSGNEVSPDVSAFDAAGNYIIAWEGKDPAGSGILAQFYNKNGVPVGTEKIVNVKTTGNQTVPRVKTLASEEAVIAWRGDDGHVWARKYDPNGEALNHSKELVHNTTTAGEQTSPAAAAQGVDGYVAVWEHTAGTNVDVKARRFGPTGAGIGDEFTVNTTTADVQNEPVVGTDSAGKFVVAWASFGQDTDLEGVYFRRFNADGTPGSNEIAVNQTTKEEQFAPALAVDRSAGFDGQFAVVWTSYLQAGGAAYDVMGRCFAASNNPLGNEFMVNTYTTNNQDNAAIALVPQGPSRYVVVWSSYGEDGDNYGIYAQRLSPTCSKQADPFKVSTTSANVQSQPVIAADAAGNFVVAWRSLNQDGDNYGVYAQRYDNAGNKVGAEFKMNPVTAGEQSTPTLAFLSDNTLMAGWRTTGEDEQGASVKFLHYKADFSAADGLDFLGNIYYQTNQELPFLCPLADKKYVVLWRSEGQDGGAGGVVGRILP